MLSYHLKKKKQNKNKKKNKKTKKIFMRNFRFLFKRIKDQHFSTVLTLGSAVMVIGNTEELLLRRYVEAWKGVLSDVAVVVALRSVGWR